jgi:peroxiredoxin Q/BCP
VARHVADIIILLLSPSDRPLDRGGNQMALEVGSKAPDFALPDENGELVKLSHFKGRRVVVFFYPKANTSG